MTMSHTCTDRHAEKRGGFTLVEVMVAASVASLVLVGLITAFVWTLRITSECQQYGWAVMEMNEALGKMCAYMRNAQGIHSIDGDTGGTWVKIQMPNRAPWSGEVSKFWCVNETGQPGDGQLRFVADVDNPSSGTNLLMRGVTEIMTPRTIPIFAPVQAGTNDPTRSKAIRIGFRVAEPLTPGDCPAKVVTQIRFRNHQ